MTRAPDDAFALRLLEFTENGDRNGVLTDFFQINAHALREAFISRMRVESREPCRRLLLPDELTSFLQLNDNPAASLSTLTLSAALHDASGAFATLRK